MADKHRSDGETVPGPQGGKLMRYPPGSNGGVHRGPDRHPRITQAQFLRALLLTQRRKRKKADGTTETVVVEMAMNEDIVVALQKIAYRARHGRGLKYFLKMLEIEEKAFRNHNRHANGNRPSMEPIAPNFVRPEVQRAEPVGEDEPRSDGGITHNGEEYA